MKIKHFSHLFLLLFISFFLQGCLDELWEAMEKAWGKNHAVINVPFKEKGKMYSTTAISRNNWEIGNFIIRKLNDEYDGRVDSVQYYSPNDKKDLQYFYGQALRSRKNTREKRKSFLSNIAKNKNASLIFYGEYAVDSAGTEIWVSLYSKGDDSVQTRIVEVESTDQDDIAEEMAMTIRNIIEDRTK